MNERTLIHGVSATTHMDLHGERLSREELEQLAQSETDHPQIMYWNHETTLPPIGIITDNWVEKREDGEYQLAFEGYYFGNEDVEPLPHSGIKGLDVTWEQIVDILNVDATSSPGYLEVMYDPRNFDEKEVIPLIGEINKLVETSAGQYRRKAELPHPVIWLLVGFVGGHIAGGFFSRLGEVAADKVLEAGEKFYEQLSENFVKLFEKAKPNNSQPDVIFNIPVSGSDTLIQGALENANTTHIRNVLKKLPEMYACAVHLIEQNSPNFFSEMKFLYNPEVQRWEINYLVTRKTNKIIWGPRYYDPQHPLRARYEKMLRELSGQDQEFTS